MLREDGEVYAAAVGGGGYEAGDGLVGDGADIGEGEGWCGGAEDTMDRVEGGAGFEGGGVDIVIDLWVSRVDETREGPAELRCSSAQKEE